MYARVGKWEGGEPGHSGGRRRISSQDGPPEGLPAKRLLMLADESSGK